MKLDLFISALQWIKESSTGKIRIDFPSYTEHMAIYQDDGLTERLIGYFDVVRQRVVLWYPERQVKELK